MFFYFTEIIGCTALGLLISSTFCLFTFSLYEIVAKPVEKSKTANEEPVEDETTKDIIDTSETDAAEISLITKIVEKTAEQNSQDNNEKQESDDEETEENDVAVSAKPKKEFDVFD